MKPERLADSFALVLALAAAVAAALVADRVFERIPHLEDEFAFLWQAEVMAEGQLYLPSPPEPKSFLVPFVVDHEARRFGKYPPGWPASLALGAALGAHWLVNPLLGGLSIWLIYRLGSRVAGRGVGLLAAFLAALSPMFHMLSGSLMSHNLSLFLSAAFSLAWLDLFPAPRRQPGRTKPPPWLLLAAAGLSMGLLALTRPLTAAGVALPFGLHGLYRFARGDRADRARILGVGALALAVTGLLPLWQAALSGDPWLNLYSLWWEYDKLGFGPGVGVKEGGHNLRWAYLNTRFSLRAGQHDLFGWPYLSWLFLPFGLLGLRRNRDGWLLFAAFPSLVLTYTLYWIGSWLFGPRYYYEALPGLAVTSAVGFAWLGGHLAGAPSKLAAYRRPAAAALLLILSVLGAVFYLPARVGGMRRLYGMSRANQVPFEAGDLEDALVVVHPAEHWSEYGTLLTLGPPFSEGDLLLVYSIGPRADARLQEAFPERRILHYYPGEGGSFYRERQ